MITTSSWSARARTWDVKVAVREWEEVFDAVAAATVEA